ncbi:MAG TPA: AAA domain-containing protein, partial [Blastococcus sp.]
QYRLSLDESGSSTPNYCLLEKLRGLHGLAVPTLTEPADGVLDLETALEAMRTALVGHGLPYRVEATADLAILQFAKFRLWKDLDEHWADFAENPLVSHLVHEPTEAFEDPARDTGNFADLDELAGKLPAAADASQLRAIAEAEAGRTFVLEGPPGTGKSQTITNLLTRAVAEGKKVLFVAEKRAALDVVARRLDAVGMGMFALDLHDKGSRASMVRAQIRLALEHAVGADEEGLAASAEDLRSARRALARYADRLHQKNAVGLSLYSARTSELAAGTDVQALPVPLPFVANAPDEVLIQVRRALALLPDIADLTRPSPRHPWAFVDDPGVDLPATQAAAGEVDAAVREVSGIAELSGVLRQARTPEDLDALVHLLSGPAIGLDVLDETFTGRWTAATGAIIGEVAAFVAFRHPGLDVALPTALQLPLAEIYVEAQTAAASSWWWGRRRKLIAVRDRLAPHLRPGAKVKPKDVPALVEHLWRAQTSVQQIAARATGVPGLWVPEGWNPFTDPDLFDREVQWLRRAGEAVDGSSAFHVALRKLIVAGLPADPAVAAPVARLRDALSALLTVCRSSSDQLAAWTGDDGFVLRWTMTRPERGLAHSVLMSLRRWVSFLDTLEPLRYAGLFDARTLLITGAVAADDATRALDRGLALASVAERLDATGLDLFDAEAHEKAIRRFTAASRAVRNHLTAALPAAVLAGRPFDAASGSGQVGALQRELAKQRRGLGVRQLLAQYGELITAVMPCVLVSPDSVARFFPAAAGLFDLVVFDEASQIRVADAIGALGRARAAVVVGDSKQMPPTSFLEPTASSEDSVEFLDIAVEDEESILSECVQARVPRQWLSWHYRSQDESLIAFSNAQYYENRLSSFPAPTHGRASSEPDGRGVSLVRVPGTFHRSGAGRLLRTNPIEAKAIVAEIRRRFDAVPKYGEGSDVVPSIGVVTFNAQQRSYIETLLRDADDDRLAAALDRADGEGLFVKNLENVQGDERDVVFFSTGFSPTADGTLPLNFGPLNRVGGERRLNVAITRARRQVVVFSSFDPEQLRAEETSSVGIKHLRAYLDMAEQGTDVLPRDARSSATVDRHRESIAAALRERGLVVRADVGLSDFRVDLSVSRPVDPETPVMAVLLDGPAWARRGTVGDRDGLPVEVLGEMLRWPVVERVWLPSWLADSDSVVQRLVDAVDTAPVSSVAPAEPVPLPTAAVESFRGVAALRSSVTAVAASVAAPVPAAPPRPAPKPAAARKKPSGPTPLDGESPFVPWIPKTAGEKSVLDELPASKAARVVRRVLNAGIKAEGPIHVDRLAKLTVGAFGLNR